MDAVLVYLNNPMKDEYNRSGWNSEHLGVCYLASALRRWHISASIIDGAAEGLSSAEVLRRLEQTNAGFVGFSVSFTTIRDALQIAEALKRTYPSVHICFGGHHATHCAVDVLANEKSVDSVIRGDGEVTIVEVVKRLELGASLAGVEGVYFRDQAGIVHSNPDRPALEDLDELAFPARDMREREARAPKQGLQWAKVCSSRGCPWNCKFCSTPNFYRLQKSRHWRSRSAKNVGDELEHLCKSYDVNAIEFCDDNFVISTQNSKDRARQIAEEILSRKLDILWFILCAANTFRATAEDEALLVLLRRAGLRLVFLGIEAGSDKTLREYGKASTGDKNSAAIDLLSRLGFGITGGIIMYHPYATLEECRTNAAFIKELTDRPNVSLYAPYCQRLDVYPGTALFERISGDGLLVSESKPYLGAYDYRFQDRSVQFLAENMQRLMPQVLDLDWLVWDTRSLPLFSPEGACDCEPKVAQILGECHEEILKANVAAFDFFTLATEMAETLDQAGFDRYAADYVARLHTCRSILLPKYELAAQLAWSGPLIARSNAEFSESTESQLVRWARTG